MWVRHTLDRDVEKCRFPSEDNIVLAEKSCPTAFGYVTFVTDRASQDLFFCLFPV